MAELTKADVERIAEWMRVRSKGLDQDYYVLSTTYYDWVKNEFEKMGKEMPANFMRQVKLPEGVKP